MLQVENRTFTARNRQTMPIKKHIYLYPEGEVGVWVTEESTDELLAKLQLVIEEENALHAMSDRRKKEWTSARMLIHHLSGRENRARCLKDEYGKPYLVDSDYQISISHSLDRTAVIAAPQTVGIDIQEIVPKMERISKKFVNEKEWLYVPEEKDRLECLHVIWGAKEAMYKAWGKKKIDFREHLFVDIFKWSGEKIEFTSRLRKGNIEIHFDVVAEKLDNFILVYAYEKYRNHF